jgi:regulator of protease activity HflC (stomatin/prohibitin superfamily)
MNHLISLISVIAILFTIASALTWLLNRKFRHLFCVPEGQAGLLYRHGLYVRRSNAGHQVIWGRGWRMNLIDLRKASLLVVGQELLTADHVGLKASLLVTYEVTEPAKAIHETQNWQGDLHNAAQLALRAVTGKSTVEALLGQRLELGAQLLARVQPEAARIGIHVFVVEIKDVTLPVELKRAFTEVLKARQEGLAALERARGESAAFRHLANAARVIDDNPALKNGAPVGEPQTAEAG